MKKKYVLLISLLISSILFLNSYSQTRDPLKWPFSHLSIWNMPIGDGAQYVHAGLEPVDNRMTLDEDIIILTPDAPMMDIYENNAGWSGNDRCVIEGGLLYSVPFPEDFVYSPSNWDGSTPNAGLASLMPDGFTIKQTQPFARCTAGESGTSKYLFPDQDLYGDGIYGAHGGSGMSAIGGALRLGELLPESGPIRHALKINIYAAENIRYDSKYEGHRWPAPVADGYAASVYGSKRTEPFVEGVVMGALLAIPQNFDLDSMNFETAPGRKLAEAFKNYGAYVVDDTYWDTWALVTAWEADGRVQDEFEQHYGYALSAYQTNNAWARDMEKIYNNLHLVKNNGPQSIGGGGTPLMPLAPVIASGRPNLQINEPLNESLFLVNDTIPFSIVASDESGVITKVELFIDDNLFSDFADSIVDTIALGLDIGVHTFYVIAHDDDGNTVKSFTGNFTVSASLPPVIESITPADSAIFEPGEVIEIEVHASDPDGDISNIRLYIDEMHFASSNTNTLSYTWENAAFGQHEIYALCSDDSETHTYSKKLTVYVGSCNTGSNLITNGDFEAGSTGWQKWQAGGNIIGTSTSTDLSLHPSTFFKVDITQVNGTSNIQIFNRFNVYENKQLILCFEAASVKQKEIKVSMKESGLGKPEFWSKSLTLDTAFKRFGPFYMDCPASLDRIEINFGLGTSEDDVFLDKVFVSDGTDYTTGVQFNTSENIVVYPNPSNGNEINVKLANRHPVIVLQIADLSGKIIHKSEFLETNYLQINENLRVGCYFLNIETPGGRFIERLIVH